MRHGGDIGYQVTLAADVCSTATGAKHMAVLSAMRTRADIRTVAEIAGERAALRAVREAASVRCII